MSFDENYVTKRQEKEAAKVISAVKKEFNLKAPSYTILGLNPWKGFAEMEESNGVEIQFANEAVEKEVKAIKLYADLFVKVIFYLEDFLKELVFIRSCRVEQFFNAIYYFWSGILDFSIEEKLIFGRVCPNQKPKHGGGTYCFTPLHLPMPTLQGMIDQVIQREHLNQFLSQITHANNHMKILKEIRDSEEVTHQMRNMLQLLKAGEQTQFDLINDLNKNKKLISQLKSVGHFGSLKLKTVGVSRTMNILPFLNRDELHKYGKRGKIRLLDLPKIFDQHKTEMEEAFDKADTDILSIVNIVPKPQRTTPGIGGIAPPTLNSHKETSEVDISTVCFPGKMVTLLQLANYQPLHGNSVKAIHMLIDSLEELS